MEFEVQLDEAQLLFLAEILSIMYFGIQKIPESQAAHSLKNFIIKNEVGPLLVENIRAILKKPLQNKEFRMKFAEYFQNHPDTQLRLVIGPWLEEILTWTN